MTAAVWAARVVLAAVFVAAAIGKVRDRAGTVQSARGLGVPARVAGPVAVALPIVELLSAVLLVVPSTSRLGALLALGLLGAFSVAIGIALRAGRTPSCHCFGARSNRPISTDDLLRNAALMVLGLVVLGWNA